VLLAIRYHFVRLQFLWGSDVDTETWLLSLWLQQQVEHLYIQGKVSFSLQDLLSSSDCPYLTHATGEPACPCTRILYSMQDSTLSALLVGAVTEESTADRR